MYVMLSLIGPIFFLIGFIVLKTIITKEIPDSRYTPFDNIAGQTTIQFHEEKEDKEEEDAQSDDKDKNDKKINIIDKST